MPEGDKPYTTSLVEALHFKQGFHYISVREMEIEIPIPDDGEGNPDYSIIQRAWWDAVDIVEKHRGIASPSYEGHSDQNRTDSRSRHLNAVG